jgi:hypothetical protein
MWGIVLTTPNIEIGTGVRIIVAMGWALAGGTFSSADTITFRRAKPAGKPDETGESIVTGEGPCLSICGGLLVS